MNENKRNLRLSRTTDAEGALRTIDDQERNIIKALIRDPRQSNNYISKVTGVPTPTVRRKRKRLEDEGLLNYFAAIDMQETGTGTFGARRLQHLADRLEQVAKTSDQQEARSLTLEIRRASITAWDLVGRRLARTRQGRAQISMR